MTRKLISGFTAAALAGAATLALGTPAHAATFVRNDANCNASGLGTAITGAPGDIVSIRGSFANCDYVNVSKDLVANASSITIFLDSGGTATVTDSGFNWQATTALGDIGEVRVVLGSTNTLREIRVGRTMTSFSTTWQTTISGGGGGGGGGSSSDSSESNPQPVLQQFGKPSIGTCDAAQPELLNIGGAESGGWSESWAEWMNGRTGGFVCTRTLVYSNALGHWVVG